MQHGCKGIEFGGKPHILDCMNILIDIWDGKIGKYVSRDGNMLLEESRHFAGQLECGH